MRFVHKFATGNYYVVLYDIVNNVVFDWNDSTWKAVGSATTPNVNMTARTFGIWTFYHADVNFVTACPDMTKRQIEVIVFQRAGGSPAPTTDSIRANHALVICGGYVVTPQVSLESLTVDVTVNYLTTAGDSIHITAELVKDGQTIPLATLHPGATCAIAVTRDAATTGGARVDQFSIDTSTVGAANAASRFEATYANPSLASNRGFTVTATIVTGSQTYVGRTKVITR